MASEDQKQAKADERSAVKGAAKADEERAARESGPAETRPESETDAAAKEASELAGKAFEEQAAPGNEAVQQAAAGRVAAMDRADQAADAEQQVLGDKTSEGKRRGSRVERGRFAGKSFVALHAMLRDGQPVYPGDPVQFDADEDEHVAALLQQGVVVEGSEGDEAVEEALGRADLARGRALAQSGY